jgi:MFS family permease
MSLFRHGLMRPVLLMSFLVAVPMFAVVSYLPLFMTVVNGASATGAGRILTPLMLGSIVASFLGGRAILRFGYRPVVFAGMCLTLAGLGLLTLLDEHSGQAVPLAAMVVLGLGMGGTMVVGILVAQNSVEMDQRGSASSTVNFVRQLGATLGVAIGGSVFLSDLSRRIEELFGVHVKASTLLQPRDEGPGLTRAMEAAVRNAFAESLGRTFVTAFVIGVVASVSAFFIPRGRPEELHDVADGTQTDPTRPPASQTTV